MRWLEYSLFLALVVGLARPVGIYLARVFEESPTLLDPVLRPVERALHRVMGIDAGREMSAATYAASFVLFGVLGTIALFLLLIAQRALPGGPADAYLSTPMSADLAANTAVSFATTTTWQAYAGETTLRYLTQAVGLVSQSGGFFNANAAHPYENPTPLTNLLALLAIAVLPASLTATFGRMTGRPRAGWVLLGVMVAMFAGGLLVCDFAETAPPPQFAGLHLVGGNMEGKETRFGVGESVLTTIVTSNGATGSYNAMQDSYQALGVLAPLANMLLGEVAFGGLGGGLYGMVMITLVAAFMGGLMIGRSPSYLGKKIGMGEMRLIILYALLTPAVTLTLTSVALSVPPGRAGLVTNGGTHGLTEMLFAYASCVANNGLTMAGLDAAHPYYNLTTMLAMLAGRFGLAGLALALAGRMAAQGRLATTAGTLPDDTPQFGALVLGVILLLGGLCFLPALALGPIAEALQR